MTPSRTIQTLTTRSPPSKTNQFPNKKTFCLSSFYIVHFDSNISVILFLLLKEMSIYRFITLTHKGVYIK